MGLYVYPPIQTYKRTTTLHIHSIRGLRSNLVITNAILIVRLIRRHIRALYMRKKCRAILNRDTIRLPRRHYLLNSREPRTIIPMTRMTSIIIRTPVLHLVRLMVRRKLFRVNGVRLCTKGVTSRSNKFRRGNLRVNLARHHSLRPQINNIRTTRGALRFRVEMRSNLVTILLRRHLRLQTKSSILPIPRVITLLGLNLNLPLSNMNTPNKRRRRLTLNLIKTRRNIGPARARPFSGAD